MDILKVLSRGVKKPATSTQDGIKISKEAQRLPSAGTQTNPQLFRPHSTSGKRKRSETVPEPDSKDSGDRPDVDFFSPKPVVQTEAVEESNLLSDLPQPAPQLTERLSEEECRQILRSHRLKFTLMSLPDQNDKVKKRKKEEKIKVVPGKSSGKDQLFPQPLASFRELDTVYGVPRQVVGHLIEHGYRTPTEVQLGALPLLLQPDIALTEKHPSFKNGVNILAIAPTGSGKTISFLLPLAIQVVRRRQGKIVQGSQRLEAIIVAPTRELTHQIVHEGRTILKQTSLRIIAMRKRTKLATGGERRDDPNSDQASDSEGSEDPSDLDNKSGNTRISFDETDILVTTPLLLLNYLRSGKDQARSLPTVRHLVLDEADVLLDPLFREHTLNVWSALTSPDLAISCWSATMGSNVETLVTQELVNRAESLAVTGRPLVRLVVGLKDTAVPNVTHKLTYTASEQGKLLALRQLLRPSSGNDSGPPLRPPFLVFTQTIDRATSLLEELKYDIPLEAGGSSRIGALHSALTDSARAGIMRKFRAGEVWILITTDVLARGIDFAGVNGVVNYDFPGSAAAYVHRAGRTGRAGREGGVVVTLYTKEDIPYVKTVANIIVASERQAGKIGDDASVQKWLLDALPQVGKADRKKLRERGVEARRSGHSAQITSRSGYERNKEHNRQGAIRGAKQRKALGTDSRHSSSLQHDEGEEWNGFGS